MNKGKTTLVPEINNPNDKEKVLQQDRKKICPLGSINLLIIEENE